MIKLKKKKQEQPTIKPTIKKRKNVFIVIDSINLLKKFFSFSNNFKIIEDKLDEVRFFEDANDRKKKDAEVLSLFAANVPAGKMLDIGTYLGNSAARMAANSPESTIYTVNIHPDELHEGGKFVTGSPKKEEIGSFYREKKLTNITQIFANTKTWIIPEEINDLSLVYIDGCHDKECVYQDTRKIIERVKKGGFILWHDCSPVYRSNYNWIDSSMSAIEQLVDEKIITPYILNLKNSWIGIWKKK